MIDMTFQPPPFGADGARPRAAEEPGTWHLVTPGNGYVSAAEAFGTWLGVPGMHIGDLPGLPAGAEGQRLVALRFLLANGRTWSTRFAWIASLEAALRRVLVGTKGVDAAVANYLDRAAGLLPRLEKALAAAAPAQDDEMWSAVSRLGTSLQHADEPTDELLVFLGWMQRFPAARLAAAEVVRTMAPEAVLSRPRELDLAYLATYPLDTYPASTVDAGELEYVIVADKGEMGVRAVREAIALKKTPVVLFSEQDDAGSLQVRLAEKRKGITIGLKGSFRESYAGYEQIATRVQATYREKFGDAWQEKLARSALYPGYGPLAENAAAIRHFRREGIRFIGPMQDVVERAGDKRRFRLMAQEIDPQAVTPGIVIDADDEQTILDEVMTGRRLGRFNFPGRLKAANGGGGRGQAVVPGEEALPAAVQKVLGEIKNNGWDAGVMFEQNIPETIHLEVQVLRDRYGNARHFGMRDCSEQRASQKIQEEAPPALMRSRPEMERRITGIAVEIAHRVGYVGAGTVELMFKDGKFYFLEMNTRIQVEHPVTEETHAIQRADGKLDPLNLVRLQMQVADGRPLDFTQEQVVATHVAREFRINAESWNADLKDARDGGRGLFVPNAGIFDVIDVPDRKAILKGLDKDVKDLKVRFDCGFEPGDTLVNKDPTFGKLIVAVKTGDPARAYESLRKASLLVLRAMRIEGRQVMPDGRIIEDQPFRTNIPDHIRILELPIFKTHSTAEAPNRHVGWVINALRAG